MLTMRKIGEITNFTVVSFTPAAICGGVFEQHAGSWRLTRTARRQLAGEKDDSVLWRELRKELHGGGDLIILTGAVQDGVFFTFDTVALPPGEQRDAVMMELPRRLLSPQDDPVVQFMPMNSPDSTEMEFLNVYTVEHKALEAMLSPLRRGRLRADELVHPLLMTKPDDPAAYLPGIDPGFCFCNRRFHAVGDDDSGRIAAEEEWRRKLGECFSFDVPPADFQELFPVLLVARGVISGDFRSHRKELQLLPKEVRPVRFRGQLRLTALLLAALIAVAAWRFGRDRWHDFREYRKVAAETGALKGRTSQMKSAIAKSSKEQKEIAKVLNSGTADREVLRDLAAISKLLPQNVMLSDFRWNESEIALTLQSENENLDLSEVFAPLRCWKVSDVQHRNARQSTITVINAKLVPAVKAAGKNGKKTKGARNRK